MSGKQDTEGGLASFGVGVPAGSKQVRVGLIVVSRSMFGICGCGADVGTSGEKVCLEKLEKCGYWPFMGDERQ